MSACENNRKRPKPTTGAEDCRDDEKENAELSKAQAAEEETKYLRIYNSFVHEGLSAGIPLSASPFSRTFTDWINLQTV